MNDDNLKIGDFVKITDGSYAVRLDSYRPSEHIGLCKDVFEVIYILHSYLCTQGGRFTSSKPVHNIHIKNTVTGNIYLHTDSFVRKTLSIDARNEIAILEAEIDIHIERIKELKGQY